MPSDRNHISLHHQHLIGLPSHRALRLLDAMPLPRACHDRLDGEYDALRVATLVISRPLSDETVIVASDVDGCGVGLIAIRNTMTSDESIDAAQRSMNSPRWFGEHSMRVTDITVLSVLHQGFNEPTCENVRRLQQRLGDSEITLTRWFCIDNMLRAVDVETFAVVPH